MIHLKVTRASFQAGMAPEPEEVMRQAMEDALDRLSSVGRITLLFNIGPVSEGCDCVLIEVDGQVFPVRSRDLIGLLGLGTVELIRGE